MRAPRSRGRAGRVRVPSSRAAGLGGTLRAQARQPEFSHFQPGDLGLRDFLEPSFLLGENSGRSCQCWDGAHRDERLRPHRAEGSVSGSRAAGFRLPAPLRRTLWSRPAPAALGRALTRAGSKMRTKPARI